MIDQPQVQNTPFLPGELTVFDCCAYRPTVRTQHHIIHIDDSIVMRNICLKIAYNGADFCGWQVQPDKRTVQGVLETAITSFSQESVRLLCAGRTDSKVHALGQVASFQANTTIPPDKWAPALNSKLPDDVSVITSVEVPPEFHATYSAVSKRYRFLIRQCDAQSPLLHDFTWTVQPGLDIDAMRTAADFLLGQHDFRCFESEWPNKATSVRTVLDVSIEPVAHWTGWSTGALATYREGSHPEFIAFEIEADGFLYNMVRAIVGSLVEVGRGKHRPDWIEEVIRSQSRSEAGMTAPPQGLYLVRVNYPDQTASMISSDHQLP